MPSLPVPGSVVARRFVVEQVIGSGGMGSVYRARDNETGRLVAIKVIRSYDDASQADRFEREAELLPRQTMPMQVSRPILNRFEREAELLSRLSHPHIVPYIAHGVDDADQPFLAMEWLEGEDLSRRLMRGPLRAADAASLMLGASDALAEAHRRGVVHRDIKPSNLFLRDGDPSRVVVLDFGIARWLPGGNTVTRSGVIIGTPGYMAPEQARAERDIGPAADVFSLGCVLYECLAGRPPFVGDHIAAVLAKVLFDEPDLSLLRRRSVAAFAGVIARMLEKDVRARIASPATVYELIRGLDLPSDEDEGAVSTAVAAATPLSAGEQQLFSVAIAIPKSGVKPLDRTFPAPIGGGFGAKGAAGDPKPQMFKLGATGSEAIRLSLAELGADVALLADGSVVATVAPSASAADQVVLAARCALVLKQRLPDVAVAVATGSGLLKERVPVGEAIDRAVRLLEGHVGVESARAESFGVVVDDLSESLLAGRFQVERGDGTTMLVREVDPLTGEDVRRLFGHPTPCVGREQELAILESALSACVEDCAARAIGVVAPPGTGKSRLRHEFLRRARGRFPEMVVLFGRGDMMSAGLPYAILGDAARRLCGIAGGSPPEIQRQQLRNRIGQHLPVESVERVTTFVGELCGLPFPADRSEALRAARSDPKVMRDQVTQAWIDWLRRECEVAPVLVLLEDIHWADALTAQLLEYSLTEIAELPLFVLALARPEVRTLFPSLWSARYMQELPLRPLSRKASERLVHEVLRRTGRAADDVAVARVVTQAAGHPLFLEELIRALAEGRGDALPETVLAMLYSRLSQLAPVARKTLRAASVFGEVFTSAGVAALIVDDPSMSLDSALSALVRAELIERQREISGAGQATYKFRHALYRDAAYNLLTDAERVEAHRLAGVYLERAGGVDPAVLAEHALKAQDRERAARLFSEAADKRLASYDLASTARFAQQALDCGVEGAALGKVRAMQAWACYWQLDMEGGYTRAIEATDLLEPGSVWWAKAIGICFYSFFMINRFEHIDRLIEAFMTATPSEEARAAYLEAGQMLGAFFGNAGMRKPAAALAEKLRSVPVEPFSYGEAFLMLMESQRLDCFEPAPYEAVRAVERAQAVFKAVGDRHFHAMSLLFEGRQFSSGLGAMDQAEKAFREAMEMMRRINQTFLYVVTHLHMGMHLAAQPDPEKRAEARSIGATYAARPEMGPAVLGAAHTILAMVSLAAGDLDAASTAIDVAKKSFAMMLSYRLGIVLPTVDIYLQQGRRAEALEEAERALATVDEQGGLGSIEVPVRLAVVMARLANGDVEGGRSALREALVQVQVRERGIVDPELRQSYLGLPHNRAVFELAQAEIGTELAIYTKDANHGQNVPSS